MQSTGVSQSVRETRRDESQTVPSSEKEFGAPIFWGISLELLAALRGIHVYLSTPILPRGQSVGADCNSGRKKAHKHKKSFWPVTVRWGEEVSGRVSRGQRFMCYLRNPRNINLFVQVPDREDRWPGWPDRVLCAKVLWAFSAPGFEKPIDQLQNRKVQKFKNTPQDTKKRLPEIPLQILSGIPKKIRKFVFSWYFRGIFSISCCRGNLDVGVVFLTYFGVWGFFFSVAGSWVVNPGSSCESPRFALGNRGPSIIGRTPKGSYSPRGPF